VTFREPKLNTGRIQPHYVPSDKSDDQTPIFSLEFMVDGYCVHSCQKDQKAHFAMALYKRSKLTWKELRLAPRDGLGYEKIARNALKVSIPAKVTEDVDMIAFRCIGQAPMVGFKLGRIFHILWIDKNFTLYNHG